MSVLPDDQIIFVINCLTVKSTWDNLILYHEGPSDVKESRVMDLKLCYNTFKFKEGESLTETFTRYKALMNKLVNDGIKLPKLEINTDFINGLSKKCLSFCQSLRNTNHVKDSELASLFGKLKYEENLIDSIYETKKSKSLVFATPLSTTFRSTSIVWDFQDSPDDEEDTRSSHEYLNDLEKEYQAKSILAKSKRFFKKDNSDMSITNSNLHKSSKAEDSTLPNHNTDEINNVGFMVVATRNILWHFGDDDDKFTPVVHSLLAFVTWLGNHIKCVTAAMSFACWMCYSGVSDSMLLMVERNRGEHLIRRFAGRGNEPDPRDVKIASLMQQIQELEFPQLQKDSPAEEAENESNVWDDRSENVNPYSGGNPGFHDDHYDNPLLTKETESEPIIWDIRDEKQEYSFKKNRYRFMILILKMPLRRENDLLGKEDLVEKKTT
nr:retrovirus-related Pol polyprotein from transposon TNT 1-94 [Tanacetum cinerariifolium]